ncbi:MAG: methyl-accepting chemotaxis protein [Ruminococcaceae bacterium]|nr:methyl-accepting chemotaxis protein [Oscillospiraceae bacterium]
MKKKRQERQRSIGYVMARMGFLMVLVGMVWISIIAIASNFIATKNLVSEELLTVATTASRSVQWELQSYVNLAEAIATDSYLLSDEHSAEEKQAHIAEKATSHGLIGGDMLDTSGIGLDGTDYSSSESFQKALKGEVFISSPTDVGGGNKMMFIAAPVWADGTAGSEVVGVVYLIPSPTVLDDIVKSIKSSANGITNILDNTGVVIATSAVTEEGEAKEETDVTSGASESEMATYMELNARMISGESGSETYDFAGASYFTAYAPIAGTNGWSIALTSPYADFLSSVATVSLIIFACIIAIGLFALYVANRLGKKIGAPMSLCTEIINGIGTGDFSKEAPVVKRKDETRLLAEATGKAIHELKEIVYDVTRVLGAVADGDLTVDVDEKAEMYVGDYKAIYESLTSIKTSLQATMEQIDIAAEQVTSGSEQVSIGASNLSEGSTSQASSVAQLASNIRTIADLINANADDAANASGMTNKAGQAMGDANVSMENLVTAMNEIADLSEEIKKINKTIEDIAFQTNILALNAAVEAARAGAAGKGFAVVADEVRNLAGKSQEAAKSTTELIENTVLAIQKGNELVSDVANKMTDVAASAGAVAQINGKISEESKNTAISINEITVGIDQISNIVQTNSATSQQSAAAAEELAGQANTLKNLIEAFKY